MKRLLVPTDFSSSSIKAIEYASKISQIVKSEITLLWVNNHETTANLSLDNQLQASVRQEAKEELKELIVNMTDKFLGIKYTSKIKTGKVFREVSTLAKAEKTSLIIVSTHGSSGFQDYWIGSNAYRVISAAPCPVISVKRGYKPTKKIISRILVPIDHTPDTLNKLPAIIEFASVFNAEINLLAIYTTTLKTINTKVENSVTTAKNMITESSLQFTFDELNSQNVAMDIIQFIEKSTFDLVAITTEQSGKDDQSGISELAQQLINRSPIPVLTVRQ